MCERGDSPLSQNSNDQSELAEARRRRAREFRLPARSAGRFGCGGSIPSHSKPELVQPYAPAPGPLDPGADRRSAFPCLRVAVPGGVGVVLPTRHLVWAAVSHARKKLTAANFVRCRRDRGESVKGGLPPPFHKSTTTNRNSPKRAEGAQGSFDSGAKRRAVRERGLNSFPLNNPLWSSDVPPLPNRSTRFTCRVPSRRRRSCRR